MSDINSKETIAPLFKATDERGVVATGTCYELSRSGKALVYTNDCALPVTLRCDPKTLEISLNGQDWYTMEQVKEALDFKRIYEEVKSEIAL